MIMHSHRFSVVSRVLLIASFITVSGENTLMAREEWPGTSALQQHLKGKKQRSIAPSKSSSEDSLSKEETPQQDISDQPPTTPPPTWQQIQAMRQEAIRLAESSSAQKQKEEIDPPRAVRWPKRKQPPLNYEVRGEEFDGFQVDYAYIRNNSIALRGEAIERFVQDRPSQDVALRLSHPARPNVRIHFYIFPRQTFIRDLSENEMRSYVGALEDNPSAGKLEILDRERSIVRPGTPIADLESREIDFRILPEADKEGSEKIEQPPAIRGKDYLVFFGRDLLVIRLTAPPEMFAGAASLTDRFLINLTALN